MSARELRDLLSTLRLMLLASTIEIEDLAARLRSRRYESRELRRLLKKFEQQKGK